MKVLYRYTNHDAKEESTLKHVQVIDEIPRDYDFVMQVGKTGTPRLLLRLLGLLRGPLVTGPQFASWFCQCHANLTEWNEDFKVDHLINVYREHDEYNITHYDFVTHDKTYYRMDGLTCTKL
jgi:hypothetical protein